MDIEAEFKAKSAHGSSSPQQEEVEGGRRDPSYTPPIQRHQEQQTFDHENSVLYLPRNELKYESFFADYGPINLGRMTQFIRTVNVLSNLDINLNSVKAHYPNVKNEVGRKKMRTVHIVTSDKDHVKSNTAYMIGAYLIVFKKFSPNQAYFPFFLYQSLKSKSTPCYHQPSTKNKVFNSAERTPLQLPHFRDATHDISTFSLTLWDVLKGLYKAIQCGHYNERFFNVEEYMKLDNLAGGDINWIIPGKFLAFSGPFDIKRKLVIPITLEEAEDIKNQDNEKSKHKDNGINDFNHRRGASNSNSGSGGGSANKSSTLSNPQQKIVYTLNASEYAIKFKTMKVAAVVRFNEPTCYDRKAFTSVGIRHVDLHYEDGSNAPPTILNSFIKLCNEVFASHNNEPLSKNLSNSPSLHLNTSKGDTYDNKNAYNQYDEDCTSSNHLLSNEKQIQGNKAGAIAVHCKAGLGRTGTNIAVYMMQYYGYTAREAISWLRICRPGSILGPQQAYLCSLEPNLLSKYYKNLKISNQNQNNSFEYSANGSSGGTSGFMIQDSLSSHSLFLAGRNSTLYSEESLNRGGPIPGEALNNKKAGKLLLTKDDGDSNDSVDDFILNEQPGSEINTQPPASPVPLLAVNFGLYIPSDEFSKRKYLSSSKSKTKVELNSIVAKTASMNNTGDSASSLSRKSNRIKTPHIAQNRHQTIEDKSNNNGNVKIKKRRDSTVKNGSYSSKLVVKMARPPTSTSSSSHIFPSSSLNRTNNSCSRQSKSRTEAFT